MDGSTSSSVNMTVTAAAALAGRDGNARPVFAPVEAGFLSSGMDRDLVVLDGENISKGVAFNIVEWKDNTDKRIAAMELEMQRHAETTLHLKRRIVALERNLCFICFAAEANRRISCGHVFCDTCAERFTEAKACPFRCLFPEDAFTPPRNIFNNSTE